MTFIERPSREYPGLIDLLCGHDDGFDICHRPIALIAGGPVSPQQWSLQTGRPPEEHPPSARVERGLFLLHGYWPDADGVYDETRHAAENVRHGRRPTLHRPAGGHHPHTALIPTLPCTVRCSRCRAVHTLRAEALNLTASDLSTPVDELTLPWDKRRASLE